MPPSKTLLVKKGLHIAASKHSVRTDQRAQDSVRMSDFIPVRRPKIGLFESLGIDGALSHPKAERIIVCEKFGRHMETALTDFPRFSAMIPPEKVLTREAQTMPARTYISQEERDSHTLGLLEETFRDMISGEVQRLVDSSLQDGGPAGI